MIDIAQLAADDVASIRRDHRLEDDIGLHVDAAVREYDVLHPVVRIRGACRPYGLEVLRRSEDDLERRLAFPFGDFVDRCQAQFTFDHEAVDHVPARGSHTKS